MTKPKWVVLDVQPHEDFSLTLSFADGKVGRFDLMPYLNDNYYQSLSNLALFMTARTACGTVVWDNDMDIAPEFLYEHCETAR